MSKSKGNSYKVNEFILGNGEFLTCEEIPFHEGDPPLSARLVRIYKNIPYKKKKAAPAPVKPSRSA